METEDLNQEYQDANQLEEALNLVDTLQDDNDQLFQENARLKKLLEESQEEVKYLTNFNSNRDAEYEDATRRIDSLMGETKNLKKTLNDERSIAEQTINNLISQNDETIKIQQIQNQGQNLTSTYNEAAEQRISELENDVQKLKSRGQALLAEHKKALKVVEAQQTRIANQENQLSAALAKCEAVKAIEDTNRELREQTVTLKSQIKELESVVTTAAPSAALPDNIWDEVDNERQTAVNALGHLQKDHESLQAEHDQSMAKQNAIKKKSKRKIGLLQAQIQTMSTTSVFSATAGETVTECYLEAQQLRDLIGVIQSIMHRYFSRIRQARNMDCVDSETQQFEASLSSTLNKSHLMRRQQGMWR